MPAKSKKQRRFMGMVHAIQRGASIPNASAKVKSAAKNMSKESVKEFAKTKEKGLPEKKKKKKKPSHFGDTFNM